MSGESEYFDTSLDHFEALERAILNILSTDQAFETYAQIADGLPTRDVYKADHQWGLREEIERNLEPSTEAKSVVETFRSSLDIAMIKIDPVLGEAYQNTPIGSRDFILRLIEIVAVICHDIAATLFTRTQGGFRKHERKPRPPPEDDYLREQLYIPPLPETDLKHSEYYEGWEHYPKGIADVVGFWAEFRLFGGAVLFDRGQSGSECHNVWIHRESRWKIYQLSDTQIQHFANVILSTDLQPNEIGAGLRFRAEKWARRVRAFEAISMNIYRNEFERKIPRDFPCVGWAEDDPEAQEARKRLHRESEEARARTTYLQYHTSKIPRTKQLDSLIQDA